MITALGGGIGIVLTFPLAAGFKSAMGTMFPVFHVTPETVCDAGDGRGRGRARSRDCCPRCAPRA